MSDVARIAVQDGILIARLSLVGAVLGAVYGLLTMGSA